MSLLVRHGVERGRPPRRDSARPRRAPAKAHASASTASAAAISGRSPSGRAAPTRALAQSRESASRSPEQGVDRELIISAIASGEAGSSSSFESADEARVRLLVAAEQLLDAGACRRQLQARRRPLRQERASALEQGRTALGELAGRRLCARPARSGARLAPALRRRRRARAGPRRTSGRRVAGVRCAAAVPASRRTATAASSPWRAERST